MKKYLFFFAAMIGLITASCSQDEPTASLPEANAKISYTATANNGSRSMTAYENGTDVSKITVSAWVTALTDEVDEDKNPTGNKIYPLPGYDYPNTGNANYFTNDVLTRSDVNGKKGTFNYETGARYWPANDEILDFFALVDNDKLGAGIGEFGFDAVDGKPGLKGLIEQKGVKDMPDMLFATAFDQKRTTNDKTMQQNVSFSFDHAFAQVVVSAEVRNPNLRVVITGMSIVGVAESGYFKMPYKSGEGKKTITNPATWKITPESYITIECLKDAEVILDKSEKTKEYLVGNRKAADTPTPASAAAAEAKANNNLLVLPNSYNGRNGSNEYQTYIQLTGYAYNIADAESGWDSDTDVLIYPKGVENGVIPVAYMNIPVEFDWKMGTINYYNIVFDCGNGGSTGTDPNTPAFIRIGYEVEVNDWVTGEFKDKTENVDNSIEYPAVNSKK